MTGALGGLLLLLVSAAAAARDDVRLDDAERFSRLVADTAYRPSETELKARYFAPASAALHRFNELRIGGASELGSALRRDRAGYRRAVEHCLPAARSLRPRIPARLDEVAVALGLGGETPRPRVTLLFGAGRSGGTVLGDDLVLALEVACRYLEGGRDPVLLLEDFLVHEAVHYHQLRRQRPGARDSLLRQVLIEGYADLVTESVLDRRPIAARKRARYGAAHEPRLWRAFERVMGGTDLGPWMYGPGAGDAPPDLGYWIGLRISEAYLRASDDPERARRELLDLPDPHELLLRSGYDGSPDPESSPP